MILWLLRLFPAFADLEALVQAQARAAEQHSGDLEACREALQELTTEKLLLQDRLDSALADKAQLWAQMELALENERAALHMQINHAVQKTGGGIPYPDAHALPAESVRPVQVPGPVGRQGRILASEAVRRQTARFIQRIAHPGTE